MTIMVPAKTMKPTQPVTLRSLLVDMATPSRPGPQDDVGVGELGGADEPVGLGVGDCGCLPASMAFSSAATVAASTVPVAGTPSSVWNDSSAPVKAGVHCPSTGPVQNPASFKVCWTAAVEASACCAA